MTKKAERYAVHYKVPLEKVEAIKNRTGEIYHVQGFAHPDIPVITYENNRHLDLFHWGLIPFWNKDVKTAVTLSNRTLNARSEEMFEKPSFRSVARKRRCIVMVDGFFEHHWKDDKSYPFIIKRADDAPFSIGGLWDCWHDHISDRRIFSVTIVTTPANKLMTQIHNKPRAGEGPRMPFIIPGHLYDLWLRASDDPVGIKQIREICLPFEEDPLSAYPVARLRGKEYKGNVPDILDRYEYKDFTF